MARFNNSYYKESYALGAHKDFYKVNNFLSFGAELFVSSGYEVLETPFNSDYIMIPSVYTKIDVNRFSGKVSLLAGTVLAVSVEYKIYKQ